MEQRQPVEVQRIVVFGALVQQLQRRLQGVKQPGAHFGRSGKFRVAYRIRRRQFRVPQGIGPRIHRGQPQAVRRGLLAARALRVAPDPPLLEPSQVAGQPQRRVEATAPPHVHAGRVQAFLKLPEAVQRGVARIHQRQRQPFTARHTLAGAGCRADQRRQRHRAQDLQHRLQRLLEIQWYLFAGVFMLGAGYAFLRNVHVRIDFISSKLSKRTNAIIDARGSSCS
jgi:hypothetical protein